MKEVSIRKRRMGGLVMLFVGASGAGWPQGGGIGQLNPLGGQAAGLHLYGTYVYTSYMTSPLFYSAIGGQGTVGIPGGVSYPGLASGDALVSGVGGSLGWRSPGKTPVTITYSAVYRSSFRNVHFNDVSQNLFFSFGQNRFRRFDRRWTVNASGNVRTFTSEDILFNPTAFGQVTQIHGNIEDLAAGLATGRFTDSEIAAILTGAAPSESPTQLLMYGTSSLAASAELSVAYARSPTTTISADVGVSRVQSLPSPGDTRQSPYVLGHTTGGVAGVRLSHSLSPRTTVSVGAYTSRTFTRYADAYVNRANVSLSRVISMRWFAEVHGGPAFVVPVGKVSENRSGLQYAVGGSLGFQSYSHGVIASFNRLTLDEYGIGGRSSHSALATWSVSRRGSSWGVFAGGGQYVIEESAFGDLTSWRAYAGVTRTITRTMSFTASYGYLTRAGRFAGTPPDTGASGIMAMFTWSPGRGRL